MSLIEKPQKLSELYFVLEKLVAVHRQLVDALQIEYQQMTVVDAPGLVESAQTKEVLLAELLNLENLRAREVEAICIDNRMNPNGATLLTIAERLDSADKQRLIAYREALGLLLAQAKEQNTLNMSFAESSLTRIEEMKRNVLGLSNNAATENYSSGGVRQSIEEHGGRLLSTEA